VTTCTNKGLDDTMTIVNTICRVALSGVIAAEAYAWALRRKQHCEQYSLARARSLAAQRPLLIFGDRSACAKGRSLGYKFSVIIPVAGIGSMCKEDAPGNLAEIPDNSVVVLVDGVLEYAPDPDAILRELRRIAGTHLFLGAQLQPWTLTATALARRTSAMSAPRSVSTVQRVGVASLLVTVVAGSLDRE
jgi:hypothetical protein